jgi:hypothetical protein
MVYHAALGNSSGFFAMVVSQRAMWVACFVLPLAAGALYLGRGDSGPAVQQAVSQATALRVPLAFERNVGQTDSVVAFVARGPGYSLFLTASEAVFRLASHDADATVLRMSLVGAKADPVIEGQAPQAGASHYLTGKRAADWRRNVERFGQVRYDAVYPGIDVVYYGSQQELEYDFIVAPGADPGRIGIRFDGAHALNLDPAGNLVLSTDGGHLVQHKPIAYQDIDGRRRPVDSRYALRDGHVAFEVGAYDRTHALVIDPVIVYRAPFGGSGNDQSLKIAVDAGGNTYVTGYTNSLDFPVVGDVPQAQRAGGNDAFVSKINAAGTQFVFNTYLGGSGDDIGRGIAIDAQGNVVVTGETASTDFPVAAPFQANQAGGYDAFVAKLSADGSMLTYSTYVGGNGIDKGTDLALGVDGSAYVTGTTTSVDFPVTEGVVQTALDGTSGAFVTKLDAQGAIDYSTYAMGTSTTIAVDRKGNAYFGGNGDVSKLSPTGEALVYRKHIDTAYGIREIVVDADGSAYVLGEAGRYFQTVNSDLTAYSGAFLCKLDPGGETLVYCGYVGHPGDIESLSQRVRSIAIDEEGSVFVVGDANRTYPFSGVDVDAFIQRITLSGRRQDAMSYVGRATPYGGGYQSGYDVAVDPAGNAYVTGAASANYGTNGTAFVARLTSPEWKIAGAGDLDGDGRADLLMHNRGLERIDWWLMNGVTPRTYATASIPMAYRVVATGDFNGDGRTDLLWRDDARTSVWIWQAEADGTFSIQFVAAWPPAGWRIVGAADVNGDAHADLLWHNPQMEQMDWWLMDGAERWAMGSKYVPSMYRVDAVGDFDGDHRNDLVWRDQDRTTLWLWHAEADDFAIQYIGGHPRSR